MLAGRIDRGAWAREINTLMLRFDPGPNGEGNKSAFARRIGLTRQTLKRWAGLETDISLESVRQVMEKLGLSEKEQTELLTRVGYLISSGDFPEPPTYPDPRKDKVIRMILADPRLTEKQREELVQLQIELIEADVQHRMAQYNRMLGYEQERRATS